jgi:hypothetical protein
MKPNSQMVSYNPNHKQLRRLATNKNNKQLNKESPFCPVLAENMGFLPTNNQSTRQLKTKKTKKN